MSEGNPPVVRNRYGLQGMTLSVNQMAQKSSIFYQWISTSNVPTSNQIIDFRIVYKFGVRNPNTALSGFSSLTLAVQPTQDMFGWFTNNP